MPLAIVLYLFFTRGVVAVMLAWIAYKAARRWRGRWFKGRTPPPAEEISRGFATLKELEDFGVANHMASLVI